jgi:hypothetical protein
MKKKQSFLRKLKWLLVFLLPFYYSKVLSQTLVGQTLDALPGDAFTYQSKSMPNYGIKWTDDSWAPGGWSAWLGSYHGFKFFTWGSPKVVITKEGSVGIGNEAPQHRLDVSGYIQSAQSSGEGGLYLGNSNHGLKRFSATNDVGLYTTYGKLSFSANGEAANHMVITANGNIGIGTTNTNNEKLSVNGKIRAQELKIEANNGTNWPDYVFQPTYKLKPLPQLEKFIKSNQHLPEVPSAKEVTANGIEVGAN